MLICPTLPDASKGRHDGANNDAAQMTTAAAVNPMANIAN
jgi:hypothetical protein